MLKVTFEYSPFAVEKLGCFFDFGYQYGKRPFPRFYNLRKKFTWFEIFVGKYAVKECEKIARNSKSEVCTACQAYLYILIKCPFAALLILRNLFQHSNSLKGHVK